MRDRIYRNLGDKVIPNIVGVDIGCGMLVQPFICNNPIDFHALNEYILRAIPSGRDFRDETIFHCHKNIQIYIRMQNN